MNSKLPQIKDKFDTDSAEHLVIVGYPENKDVLSDLIFWSCFPNDPVCWVTHPYVASLRSKILAPAIAKFLEFNLINEQHELISDAFLLFINERGEPFRDLICRDIQNDRVQDLFRREEYSLKRYQSL